MKTPEINPGFKMTCISQDHRYSDVEFRRYRMKWENYPAWDIVDRVPIHLDLEVTARCQLQCPGCPSMKLEFNKGDMKLPMAEEAIAEFGSAGGDSIKFNWRGEPTLYKGLPTLVRLAKDYGLIDMMINTNGVSLTPELGKKLVNAGITTVAFSIDSVARERYAQLRPGAVLDKTMANFRDFLKLVEKNDDVAVRVQRIEYPDEEMPHEEFVAFFESEYPRVNYVASNHYKNKELEGDLSRESKPCAQLWQRMVMTYDGWMGPCCEFNRFGEHRFGRFPDVAIKDVWNSIELQGLRRYHREDNQNAIGPCARCTVTKPMVRH